MGTKVKPIRVSGKHAQSEIGGTYLTRINKNNLTVELSVLGDWNGEVAAVYRLDSSDHPSFWLELEFTEEQLQQAIDMIRAYQAEN